MTASERPAPWEEGTGLNEHPAAAKLPRLDAEFTCTDAVSASVRERYPADLRRRRAASLHLDYLEDGRRDPLEPRPEPLTDSDLDRWAAALRHLKSVGLTGLPPADVQRALAAQPARYADCFPRWPDA